MKVWKSLLLAALTPLFAFGAANDVLIQQRNAADTAYANKVVSPAASSLLGFGSDKAVRDVTLGTGLSMSVGGVLSASGAPGEGTVTNFTSGDLSPLFTTSVATATSTPALTFTLSTHTANTVFAGPTSGGAAGPTFRSLVTADLPSGVGDVVGPLSTTDNALARFDTTTGKLIQNSVGILSDAGALSGILSFNGNTWATGTGTLSIGAGKTFTLSNTLTLTATDGSTLAIGTGGTLGSAAYTSSSAYVPAYSGLTTNGLLQATGATTVTSTLTPSGLISFGVGATNTATSGNVKTLSITPTYNQASGTAANTDLFINRTETAIGSGAQYLIDAQVGNSSVFNVDRAGVAYALSFNGAPAYSFIGAGTTGLSSKISGNIALGLINQGTLAWYVSAGSNAFIAQGNYAVLTGTGTTTSPTYAFQSDSGTGLANSTSGRLDFITGSTNRGFFNSSGLTLVIPLAYGSGGTGATTFTNHGAVVAGASALTTVAPGSNGNVLTSNGTDWTSAAPGTGGTVTTVGWTGGIVSVANPTTTPAFTIAGTSGGIPYFASSSTWASSGALTASQVVLGGGAGSAPTSLAAGSQYVPLTMGASNPGYTALALNQGAATSGQLLNTRGGTGQDSSGSTGVAQVSSGTWSFSTALANGTTATTQAAGTNDTTVATMAALQTAILQGVAKEAVKYSSTTALPTVVYANGSSGVGATLTGAGLGALSLDSNTPSVADRVLIKNQVSTFQNGLYTVTAVGSGAAVFVMTRATDFNQSAEIKTGDSVFVTSGTVNGSTTWVVSSADSPVIGTDAITFSQTAGPGSITSGNGITVTGASVAIDTSVTVDKTTAQTLSTKTFTSPVINGATSSGSTSIDLSGNSGLFKTTTGANTFGGSSNTFSAPILVSLSGTLGSTSTSTSTNKIENRLNKNSGTSQVWSEAVAGASNADGMADGTYYVYDVTGANVGFSIAPSTAIVTIPTSLVSTGKITTLSTIELGNASDTTLSRVSAGVAAIEGVTIDTISATNTLTNKRVTARITPITSSATPTVNTDSADCVTITALATAITSMTSSLSGTPVNFDQLEYRIKDDGTARAITWGTSFATGTGTLPTTTTLSKVLHVYFEWDSVQSKWICAFSGSEP